LASIEDSRVKAGPDRVLAGLGIPGIGKASSRELIRCFKSIDNIAQLSAEELTAAGDIGLITAQSITGFFSEDSNKELLERLKNYGLCFEAEEVEAQGNVFEGKTFCITGTLPGMDRNEASALIESWGGKVTSSVSGKTDYLLAGDAAGSKLNKAISLGVNVISLDDLKKMIGEG
jgi:DNA ligase (NAD+)